MRAVPAGRFTASDINSARAFVPRASDPVIGVLSANLGARLCHQPRFSLLSSDCFNRPQVNQHLARGNI